MGFYIDINMIVSQISTIYLNVNRIGGMDDVDRWLCSVNNRLHYNRLYNVIMRWGNSRFRVNNGSG
jgi:hypothetical protein